MVFLIEFFEKKEIFKKISRQEKSMQNYLVGKDLIWMNKSLTNEPLHEISNNVVCATSKASDQPAHMRSLIRAFASRLNIP